MLIIVQGPFINNTKNLVKTLSNLLPKNKIIVSCYQEIIDDYLIKTLKNVEFIHNSDPGSILVNECINNEIKIFPIPGPSAIAVAVSISGFSDKFLFCDTNILTTIAWSRTHFNGYCNEWIIDQSKKLSYDYYLILNF